MLVDGISTCDGRYPHVEFSDGFYYNIIDIKESKNEEHKIMSKNNSIEKNQYYMSKYGTICNKKNSKDYLMNSNNSKNNLGNYNYNKINTGNSKGNNKFFPYSPDNKVNQFTNISNIDARRFNNINNYNYKTNENIHLQQGPNVSQFPNFIEGANINNFNINNNNNYLYTFTDSNNNVNTGPSLREEQLETRNTWENQSYFSSSNPNSQKTNNSNTENQKNKCNLNNEEEINDFEFNNNQNRNLLLDTKAILRQESYNTFNSNFTNNDEYYFNEWIYNYNELRRNLLPNEYNTKTVSYMEKLKQCIKDESEVFFDEISN